jgi:DNA invertase Pin-like site-specific DNA recombinase
VIAIFAPGQNKEADALFGYVKQRRWDDIHDVRVIGDHDGLKRALKSGRVEVVLASTLQALGRSQGDLTATLREIAGRQIQLIVPSQGISGVSSEMLLIVLNCIEEFRRSVRVERTKQAMRRAKRRGARLGRPAELELDVGKVKS